MNIKKVNRLSYRLFLSLLHHRIYGRERWRVIERDGIKYRIQWDGFGKRIAYHGGLENDQFNYLATQIEGGGYEIFLDIGAHFGSYALRIAAKNYCTKVYAVEGSEKIFNMLRENFALNDFNCTVKPINAVVSDEIADRFFYEAEDTKYSDLSGMEESELLEGHVENVRKREVETTTLDSLFSFRRCKVVIKMDVEGHELHALKGAARLLSENQVLLQIEIWERNISHLDYLRQNGFKVIHRIGSRDFFLRNF